MNKSKPEQFTAADMEKWKTTDQACAEKVDTEKKKPSFIFKSLSTTMEKRWALMTFFNDADIEKIHSVEKELIRNGYNGPVWSSPETDGYLMAFASKYGLIPFWQGVKDGMAAQRMGEFRKQASSMKASDSGFKEYKYLNWDKNMYMPKQECKEECVIDISTPESVALSILSDLHRVDFEIAREITIDRTATKTGNANPEADKYTGRGGF